MQGFHKKPTYMLFEVKTNLEKMKLSSNLQNKILKCLC